MRPAPGCLPAPGAQERGRGQPVLTEPPGEPMGARAEERPLPLWLLMVRTAPGRGVSRKERGPGCGTPRTRHGASHGSRALKAKLQTCIMPPRWPCGDGRGNRGSAPGRAGFPAHAGEGKGRSGVWGWPAAPWAPRPAPCPQAAPARPRQLSLPSVPIPEAPSPAPPVWAERRRGRDGQGRRGLLSRGGTASSRRPRAVPRPP